MLIVFSATKSQMLKDIKLYKENKSIFRAFAGVLHRQIVVVGEEH